MSDPNIEAVLGGWRSGEAYMRSFAIRKPVEQQDGDASTQARTIWS